MKRIHSNLIVGGNGGINLPTLVEQELPPPPPQMNAPVGPPPPPGEIPNDYQGYVDLAKKASRGAMTEKALIWVGLAQAAAMNRIGDLLEELVEFTGARDAVPGDTTRLFDVLADALESAVPKKGKKS